MSTPEVKEISLTAQAEENSLEVKRERGATHDKCGHIPTSLCGGIHLSKKLGTHVRECPRTGQLWEKKQDNWPKINKDPEKLSYVSDLNHLFTALLLGREDTHTLSFWVCISALLLS